MLVNVSVIIYFFIEDISTLTSPGIIFDNFKEKNNARKFILTLRIIYLVYVFLQNFVAVCFWVFRCKEERQKKEDLEYATLNRGGETPLYNQG